MIKFEIGKEYFTRSICNHDCIFTIKIVSRSPKTIVYEYDGETRRSKLNVDEVNGCEFIRPDRYSMAPVFGASSPVVEEPQEAPAVEEPQEVPAVEEPVLLYIGQTVIANSGAMFCEREGKIVGFSHREESKLFSACDFAVIVWTESGHKEHVEVSSIHHKGWVSLNGSGIGVFVA